MEKQKKGSVHFYPSYSDIYDFIMLDITTFIPLIVQFDLEHIEFTIGKHILKQINGCPMGGFLSAHYAIITCAYYEYKFHSSLLSSSHIFTVRYMDDLLCIHTFDSSSIAARQQSFQTIQQLLNNCYDSSLELELTCNKNGNDRWFTYLDCTLSITNDIHHPTIILSPYMKNDHSIRTEHRQIFMNFQHWNSHSSSSVKKGVVKSTVLRLYRNSNHPTSFLFSIIQIYHELQLLHYPSYILLNTIKSCYQFYEIRLFHRTYQIIKAIHQIRPTQVDIRT